MQKEIKPQNLRDISLTEIRPLQLFA